jgi:hypothetical protein
MQIDSMISSMMWTMFLSTGMVLLVVVGIAVFVIRTIARGNNAGAAAGRMQQPMPGTLLVTAVSLPTENAVYHSARLTGVVSGEGVAPTATQFSGLIRTSKWPRSGQTLPVIVDRANPHNFAIEWDKVQDGGSAAMDQAEALAAAMRDGRRP